MAAYKNEEKMKDLKVKKQPDFISPQLATLTENYFSSKDWIYEEKFDGIRCIAVKKNNKVNLYSRNRKNLNNDFPNILDALQKETKKNFILDGEIVAFKDKITSFSKLQQRKKEKVKTYLYAFDLPYFDKYDLRKLKLIERKDLLKKNFKFSNIFRYTKHIEKDGEKFLKKACREKKEGIIAKKKDATYKSKRVTSWLKFKCSKRGEFLIIGYTDPQSSRIGFGALLIGYYKNGKLKFAGKVGTGFDFDFLKEFSEKLKKIEVKKNYFPIKNAHFVKIKYVGEIGFSEWTNDNKLRHPRFLALRSDKSIKQLIKETPKKL